MPRSATDVEAIDAPVTLVSHAERPTCPSLLPGPKPTCHPCHSGPMADVDLVDETFIAARRDVVAAALRAGEGVFARWWPDLTLVVFMDRGDAGVRWSMTGALVGSCEIWLEEVLDGTLLHYYLRGAPTDRTGRLPEPLPDTAAGWRAAASLRSERATAWKKIVWRFKDDIEGERLSGEPAVTGV
jgi:hypothetical protein